MLDSIFDSHAHYDDEAFDGDRDALLGRLLPESGIQYVVNVGTGTATIESSLALAAAYPYVYCAVGHHPHSAKDAGPGYLEALRERLRRPKTVALGEIGLDYHYDLSPRDVQRRVFREQLALAGEMDVPVIIHSREATADTLEALRESRPQGIVHCFSGSAETAREMLRLGLHLGFTGVVTFKNAKKALEAVAVTPLDRLLIETDCPYMTPTPHRGERNDSRLLPLTAAAVAAVKGVDVQELIQITNENARRVYRI